MNAFVLVRCHSLWVFLLFHVWNVQMVRTLCYGRACPALADVCEKVGREDSRVSLYRCSRESHFDLFVHVCEQDRCGFFYFLFFHFSTFS